MKNLLFLLILTLLYSCKTAEDHQSRGLSNLELGYYNEAIDDFNKAENFLIRAVQLMPDDPIVIDHYGDILWKLNRKIQARYFWLMVLDMEDAEQKLKDNIENKIIDGPESS